MSSNVKRTPRMVGVVTKPSGEGGDKEEEAKHPHNAGPTVAALVSKGDKEEEAKHPHDADQKVAALDGKVDALDSKVDAVVFGSHKKKRTQYTEDERVALVAMIREALEEYVGNKKVVRQIILNHGITPSVYYKWAKECVLCDTRIKSLSIHCVACSTKTCNVRLCYGCFGKHFIRQLSMTPTFLQVSVTDCG